MAFCRVCGPWGGGGERHLQSQLDRELRGTCRVHQDTQAAVLAGVCPVARGWGRATTPACFPKPRPRAPRGQGHPGGATSALPPLSCRRVSLTSTLCFSLLPSCVAKQLRPRLSRWGLRGNCRSSNRMCFMTCLCRAHSGRPCHSESLRWGGPGLPEGTGCPFVVSVARVSLAASSSTNELRLWPAGRCPQTRASAVCAREEAGHRRGRCLSHGRRSAPGQGGSMVPAFTLLS